MPADAIALLIVLLFAVPGLITRTLIARSIPRQQGDVQQWVVEVILFGAISFLITTVVYSVVAGITNDPLPTWRTFRRVTHRWSWPRLCMWPGLWSCRLLLGSSS